MVLPSQTILLPEMVPVKIGAVSTVIDKVCANEVPQANVAVTVKLPPALPANEVMLLLVLLPVQLIVFHCRLLKMKQAADTRNFLE